MQAKLRLVIDGYQQQQQQQKLKQLQLSFRYQDF